MVLFSVALIFVLLRTMGKQFAPLSPMLQPSSEKSSNLSPTEKKQLYLLILVIFLIHVLQLFAAGQFAANVTGVGFFDTFFQWDSRRYAFVAANGYIKSGAGAENIVFFPAFPLLMRAVSEVFQVATQYSGVLTNILLTPVMILGVYRLASLDLGHKSGLVAVALLEAAPWSHNSMLAYTETLFIGACVWGVYCFRQRHYFWSFLVLLLAGLTRPTGIALFPLLFMEVWILWRTLPGKLKPPIKAYAPVIAPILGYLIYLGINFVVFSDFFASGKFMVSEWHKRVVPMPEGLALGLFNTLDGFVPKNFSQVITERPSEVLAICSLTIFTFYAGAKSRVSYAIFLAANLFIISSTSWILSSPRYVAAMFPVAFIAAPYFATRGKLLAFILVVGLSFQTFYLILFCTGHWSF